jgi:hypothetical protein
MHTNSGNKAETCMITGDIGSDRKNAVVLYAFGGEFDQPVLIKSSIRQQCVEQMINPPSQIP